MDSIFFLRPLAMRLTKTDTAMSTFTLNLEGGAGGINKEGVSFKDSPCGKQRTRMSLAGILSFLACRHECEMPEQYRHIVPRFDQFGLECHPVAKVSVATMYIITYNYFTYCYLILSANCRKVS